MTRFAAQTGHYVERRAGWDCHGLPVEYEIDQKLKITRREQVLDMGIENYNKECRSIVTRYTGEWEETVTRLGRWIDFRNDYKTMNPEFMESVWWVFKQVRHTSQSQPISPHHPYPILTRRFAPSSLVAAPRKRPRLPRLQGDALLHRLRHPPL